MKKNPKYRYTHIPHAYTHSILCSKNMPPHQKKTQPKSKTDKTYQSPLQNAGLRLNIPQGTQQRTILELILPD